MVPQSRTNSHGLPTVGSNHQSRASTAVHSVDLRSLGQDQLEPSDTSRISGGMQRSPAQHTSKHRTTHSESEIMFDLYLYTSSEGKKELYFMIFNYIGTNQS